MPEIGEINDVRIFFYSNEGALEGLPRVFATKGDAEAEFLISQDAPPITVLKRSHGFEGEELRPIQDHIKTMAEEIAHAWNELFC